jgi:hypothetical protein
VRTSTRHWFQLEFADPVTIYAADAMWSWDVLSGTGGVQAPLAGNGGTTPYNIYQYGGTPLVQPAWQEAAGIGLAISGSETGNGWNTLSLTNKDGSALAQIGSASGPAAATDGNSAENTFYNFAGFTPVTTSTFRMVLNKSGTTTQAAGIGVQEWKVYALEPTVKAQTKAITVEAGELAGMAATVFPAVYEPEVAQYDFANNKSLFFESGVPLKWNQTQIDAAAAAPSGEFTIVGTNNTLGFTLTVTVTVTAAQVVVDKTALKAAMDAFEALEPDEALYTEGSWADAAAAYAAAAIVYANADAEQGDVDAAKDALLAAIAALEPKPILYTVSVVAGANGSIDGGDISGQYAAEATINIKAVADAGYEFDKWVVTVAGAVDDEDSAEAILTVPAGAVTVTATFKEIIIDQPGVVTSVRIIAETIALKKESTYTYTVERKNDGEDATGTFEPIWSVSNAAYATVVGDGLTATVTTLNKAGTVTLKCTVNGISHNITLRIA